jgi:hypothetical protein
MISERVTYKGKRITVHLTEKARKGICACCGKKGFTSLHHWKYAFTLKQIRKMSPLAILNTSELCFTCHNIANAMRKIYEAPKEIVIKLNELKRGTNK